MQRTLSVWFLAAAALSCTDRSDIPADPSSIRFLTQDTTSIDYWPTFSPDGRTVLFSRSTDGRKTWSLVVVPAEGGEVTPLAREPLPVSGTRASWYAPQNLIAFTGSVPGPKHSVWLINGDGTMPREVVASGLSERVFYPSWYPDGRSVTVMDAVGEVLQRINLETLAATPITAHDQVLTGMPSVSPDGKWVVFAGQANEGQKYDQLQNILWVIDDKGSVHPLEAAPGQGRAPVWSPDGRWVAFESTRGDPEGRYAVFIIRREGTNLRRITPYDINANHPVWSPDGRRLVFSAWHAQGRKDTGIAIMDFPVPTD